MTTSMKTVAQMLISIAFMVTAAATAATNDEQPTISDVQQEMREAANAITGYSAKQRDKAINRVKISLSNLDAHIERLENRLDKKADRMDQAAREKATSTLKALRKQRNKVAEWYGGMQHSSTEAWQDIKTGFLKSYQSLQESFDKAKNEF